MCKCSKDALDLDILLKFNSSILALACFPFEILEIKKKKLQNKTRT